MERTTSTLVQSSVTKYRLIDSSLVRCFVTKFSSIA